MKKWGPPFFNFFWYILYIVSQIYPTCKILGLIFFLEVNFPETISPSCLKHRRKVYTRFNASGRKRFIARDTKWDWSTYLPARSAAFDDFSLFSVIKLTIQCVYRFTGNVSDTGT
jgi:hypothetical protein